LAAGAGCSGSAARIMRKVYSLHAPEVECIGKGKPHKPYEFGVKVSVAIGPPAWRRPGG
jgi:IS5 family transposase